MHLHFVDTALAQSAGTADVFRRYVELKNVPSFSELQTLHAAKESVRQILLQPSHEGIRAIERTLPHDAWGLLCFGLWIAHNCPDTPEYGKNALYECPQHGMNARLPCISQHGGTLFEQLAHYIHLRLVEKEAVVKKEQLEKIREHAQAEHQLDFEGIHQDLKGRLAHLIYTSYHGEVKEWEFGERKLRENAQVIFRHCEGQAIVDKVRAEVEADIEKSRYYLVERPLRTFEAASKECTYAQRAALFHALSPEDKSTIGRRLDAPYWGIGIESTLHHFYGAHSGEGKTIFRFFAPHAHEVRIRIYWAYDPVETRPMMQIGGGNFETTFFTEMETVPYDFEVVMKDGRVLRKTDPFARGHCLRPDPRAIVRCPWFEWSDGDWMRDRASGEGIPRSIYKVFLGGRSGWKSYAEHAQEIGSYAKEMGFTHVEFPVCEFQTDGSLGYQAFGFFSPTSRFGTLNDFQGCINYLHKEGIGVIIDVPTHFVPEWWSLDGMGVYESGDTEFGTKVFSWGNPFVRNFFISALVALCELHVDGIRLDFVEHVLREPHGHTLLQELTRVVHARFPDVLLIAENAHDTKDTQAIEEGGLGFNRQIALGETSILARVLASDFPHRNMHEVAHCVDMLSREKGVLAYSHDVYPSFYGDEWKQQAGRRLFFSCMAGLNADTLCYMGQEIGTKYRPDPRHALDWERGRYDLQKLVKDVNHLQMQNKALWCGGSAAVIGLDAEKKILGILRVGCDGARMVVVLHFGAEGYSHFFFRMQKVCDVLYEAVNTDASWYGGTGSFMNNRITCYDDGIALSLPPLAALFLHT